MRYAEKCISNLYELQAGKTFLLAKNRDLTRVSRHAFIKLGIYEK
jgi:hypothetical protein